MAVIIFPTKSPHHWICGCGGVIAIISNFPPAPPKSRLNHIFHHNSAVSPIFPHFCAIKRKRRKRTPRNGANDAKGLDANDAKGLDANDAKGLAMAQTTQKDSMTQMDSTTQ